MQVEEIWRKYDAIEARLSAPLSARMIELAGIAPGMRVLDLATGRGEPAIPVAERVGPSGYVLGVDLEENMLAMARERIAGAGLQNIELRAGDATKLEARGFDAVTVRWGLMYMSDPVAALVSSRKALVAGGVFAAALWAEPERVSYYTLPRRVLGPLAPIDFEAPGIFRFAHVERITRDLDRAGLAIDRVEEMDVPVIEGTPEELAEWALAFGMRKLLEEPDRPAWKAHFISELEATGVRQLGGITRIVTARPR